MREVTAQKVLLDAFIGEVLDEIEEDSVRRYADKLIADNFNSKN
jgi:hypothetical protein